MTLSSSCLDAQEALIVTHAIAFPDSETCIADPSAGIDLAGDTIDLSFNSSYKGAFALLNNLTLSGLEGTNTGVEASEMKLLEAIVTLTIPGDPSLITAVEAVDPSLVNYSQPVATDSFIGGESIGTFVDIPAATLNALRDAMGGQGSQTMIMSLKFRAERSSNTGVGKTGVVESRSFEFPISLCFNCLRDCKSTLLEDPAGMTDGVELCTAAACNGTEMYAGGACGRAQTTLVQPVCCSGENAADQAIFCSG